MFKDFRTVLKNKNFVYLWLSQVLSLTTINIMNFVLLITIFERTGSTIATSLIWVAYALPVIMVGPFASVVVDFVDKRKLLMYSNFIQALLIFIFALSKNTTFFFAYGLVFLYSLLNQFYLPSESSSLPSLVSKKSYAIANSLFFLTSQFAMVIGYGLAGIILILIGQELTLYLCSFFLFMAFITVIFLPELKVAKKKNIFELGVVGYFRNIWKGYVFIKNNHFVFAPLITLLSFSALLAIVMVNVPSFVDNVLGLNLNLAGLMLIAPAGVGALVGAFYLPKILKKNKRKKTIIESSLLMISVALLLLTFGVPFFTGAIKIIFSIILTSLIGFAAVGIIVPAQTFLQLSTPPEFRGRVFGNYSFLSILISIFPVIFSSTLSEIFGVRFLFFIISGICFMGLILSKRYGDNFLNNE